MAQIFLSYQKRDRALAQRVGEALRRRGLSVWWDQDVTPRESWDRILEREIAASDVVLVLWTRNSVESDWVRIEANYARNCKPSKLVQARFDQSEVPIAFSLVQYLDLDWDHPDRSPEWPRLMQWLAEATNLAQPGPSADPPARPETRTTRVGGVPYGWDLGRPLDRAEKRSLYAGAIIFSLVFLLPLILENDPTIDWKVTEIELRTFSFGAAFVGLRLARRDFIYPIVYFFIILTLCHWAAYASANEFHGKVFSATASPSGGGAWGIFVSGLLGGFVGSTLSFLGLLAIKPSLASRRGLGLMALGILSLTLIGGIGLRLYFGGTLGQNWSYLLLYIPWQAAFAFFLIRLIDLGARKVDREADR